MVDNSINPYTQKGTVLEIVATSTLPEAGAVKTVVDTDTPRIELDKWNGEVKLGITSLDIPAKTTGSRPLLSKNVEWGATAMPGVFGGTNAISMEAVPIDATTTMEDGGMEININLTSEPASNVFTFQLDNYEDLNFFYQAPLWQEAGLKAPTDDCTDTSCSTDVEGTSTRPENVVGSYAVYYKDHANHVEGQTNYATGKAYQIFRPQVSDANGNTTWAELAYSNGMLTVSVPQDFLDSAAYPVKVDPTFGYTTAGASNLFLSLNLNNVDKESLLENGSVSKLTMYVLDNPAGINSKGIIYTDASNPLTWVANSIAVQAPASQAWTDYAVSASLTTGNYWLGLVSGGSFVGIAFDSGGASIRSNVTNSFANPSSNSPFGGSFINDNNKPSVYATYTASGGGTVPTKNVILNGGTMRLSGGTMQI